MEQLDEKFNELFAITAAYDIDAAEIRDEIADAMEAASKVTQEAPSHIREQNRILAVWWVNFLVEWASRCFLHYTKKCGNSRDYKRMEQLWVNCYEPIWKVGCEIARVDRLMTMKQSMSKWISAYPKPIEASDEALLWKYVEKLDEAGQKAIELYSEKSRAAFTETLKSLKEYDRSWTIRLKEFVKYVRS